MSEIPVREHFPKMIQLFFVFVLLSSLFSIMGTAQADVSVDLEPYFLEGTLSGGSVPNAAYVPPLSFSETIYTSDLNQISILTNYPINSVYYFMSNDISYKEFTTGEIISLANNTITFYAGQFNYNPNSIVGITIYYNDSTEKFKTFRFKAVMTSDGNNLTFVPYETQSSGESYVHHDIGYFDSNYSSMLAEDGPINAVYLYGADSTGHHQLQSYYWYRLPESFSADPIPKDESLSTYHPAFEVNVNQLENLNSFDIHTVFLCSNHDREVNGTLPGFVVDGCGIFSIINITANNATFTISSTDGSGTIINNTHVDEFGALKCSLSEHKRMLTVHVDLKFAEPYLNPALNEQEYFLKFNPGNDFESYTVPFIFKFIEPGVINIPIPSELTNGTYVVNVPSLDVPAGNRQTLSALSFPKELGDALKDNRMTIDFNAGQDVFSGSGIQVVTGNTESVAVSFFDINFKKEINSALKENNLTVGLTFKIPKKIDGEHINKNEIVIYHKVQSGGDILFEKLPIQIDDVSDPDYFLVTAETCGFSPFAAILVPQASNSGSSSSSNADLGDRALNNSQDNNSTPSQVQQPDPKPNPMNTIVHKIKGYFSTFSVLVVLISGMAMWNYLRKSI
ncbi:hypothetical protein [Methanolapillus millepedarum]|uniref:Uncharacterized protein n=1 Tax=Methanolapillus millepedarum TaxID=3028296 RepID=A0AA96V214_9EURY|nr:hypothetical protein MsAc7_05190 [Methanosarcinaceae archaeon Ac7]